MVGWWWGNFSPAAWAVQHSTQTFSRETVFQNTSVFISEYACISYSFALLGTYKTAHNYWRWRWLKPTSSQRCRRGHRAAGRRGEGEKLTQKQKHTLKLLFTNVCWKKRLLLLAQASRKRVIRIITKNDRQFTIFYQYQRPSKISAFHRELYELPWDRRRFSAHRARVQSAGLLDYVLSFSADFHPVGVGFLQSNICHCFCDAL